jgi:hypothetical protein
MKFDDWNCSFLKLIQILPFDSKMSHLIDFKVNLHILEGSS